MPKMKKLLIIGSGPCSSLIAYNLFKIPKLRDILEVHVFEKAQYIGGRYGTTRNPQNIQSSFGDLGAQYLTNKDKDFKNYFNNMLENNLIKILDTSKINGFKGSKENVQDYICSEGTCSIIKHFFKLGIKTSIINNKKVIELAKENDKIRVLCEDERDGQLFDVVVSTIPIPELLLIKNFNKFVQSNKALSLDLASVKYTTRYALGLFFNENIPLVENESAINFVQDQDIRYWSEESAKRNNNSIKEPSVFIVHSSIDLEENHKEKTLEELKEILIKKAYLNIQSLPKNKEPAFIKCIKWEYSQVFNGYPYSPGFAEIHQNPTFIVTGDGFSSSGFEGCAYCAEKTTEHLRILLTA